MGQVLSAPAALVSGSAVNESPSAFDGLLRYLVQVSQLPCKHCYGAVLSMASGILRADGTRAFEYRVKEYGAS